MVRERANVQDGTVIHTTPGVTTEVGVRATVADFVGEIVFSDSTRIAPYLRPDELHLGFNFSLVFQPWDAEAIRRSIDESLAALPIVSWVLENHDVTRIVTRFGEREARAAALLCPAFAKSA